MKKIIPILTIVAVLALFGGAGAAMMGPGSGTTASMMGGGFMMTNTGGFGMMNGMAAAPVVGDDGTAYLVSYNPSANPGPVPTSNSFESTLTAATVSGAVSSITLSGIASRPVVAGNVLAATSSLPDMGNYNLFENLGSAAPSGQSTLYVVNLPLTSSSVPMGVSLDGQFASIPVIASNAIYVVTSDFGNGMMTGSGTFDMFNAMYHGYNFNNGGTAKSYLYIIGFDGSVNKIPLQ
jgi:hypothetical protein